MLKTNKKKLNIKLRFANIPIFIALLILHTSYSFILAQSVGIGTLSPHGSALLDINASPLNNKGILIPRLTAVQRITMSGMVNSLLVFDTDSACFF